MDAKLAELNGLVLTGGKSTRMWTDKGMIPWHGKAQQYYMAGLLHNYCKRVYISCNKEQKLRIDKQYPSIEDRYTDIGPFGGILSAFSEDPECAWLAVANDLPLLDHEGIAYLVSQRDPTVIATVYENPVDGLPEPMVAIWEPAAFPVLLSFLQSEGSSLRKVLIKNKVKLVKTQRSEILINVNTPEEASKIKII